MATNAGKDFFHIRIRPHPFNVLRINKTLYLGAEVEPKFEGCEVTYCYLPIYRLIIVSQKIMSKSVVLDLHSLYNLVEKAGTLTHYPADPESTWTYSGKAHIWAGAGLRFIDTSCLEPLSYLQLNCADCIDQFCKRYYILTAHQHGVLSSDSHQFHRELCRSVPETFPPGVVPVRIVFPVECVEPLANLMAQQHAWTLDRSSSPFAQRRD